MSELIQRRRVAALFPIFAALLACSDGGANANQNAPGDEAGGIAVGLDDRFFGIGDEFSGLGEIAVSPHDDYVVFAQERTLAVGYADTGRVRPLPVEGPTRLAFSKRRTAIYVGAESPSDRIAAIDVYSRDVLWHTRIDDASTSRLRIAASEDDQTVIAANASTGTVSILDAQSGDINHSYELDEAIVDIRILPDDRRALVVLDHTWESDTVSTPVVIVPFDGGSLVELSVPNCADRVAISGDGQRAFLAPTTCIDPASSRAKDPISLIDLTEGRESFVRNLPGFGPVAVSPSGTTAVGFLDMDNVDESLFDDPTLIPATSSDRYHLMLLDTDTLEYEFAEYGNRLPRFAITPDGNVLLVDSDRTILDVPARLFDVGAREWRHITGEPLMLDEFVITSDSSHAYVIESRYAEGLYDIDIAAGTTEEIPLPFVPRNINITPTDDALYLRKNDSEICVFSLEARTCGAELRAEDLVVD